MNTNLEVERQFKEILLLRELVTKTRVNAEWTAQALDVHLASDSEKDRFMYGEFERQSREIVYLKVSLWALALLTALNFVLGVK